MPYCEQVDITTLRLESELLIWNIPRAKLTLDPDNAQRASECIAKLKIGESGSSSALGPAGFSHQQRK